MQVKRDLPAGLRAQVNIETDADGRQVVRNEQGEELIEFTPVGKSSLEIAFDTAKAIQEADEHLAQAFGVPADVINAPNPPVAFPRAEYKSPTKANREESKARRKLAKKSRKINRRRH